jgi:hypothetical protein
MSAATRVPAVKSLVTSTFSYRFYSLSFCVWCFKNQFSIVFDDSIGHRAQFAKPTENLTTSSELKKTCLFRAGIGDDQRRRFSIVEMGRWCSTQRRTDLRRSSVAFFSFCFLLLVCSTHFVVVVCLFVFQNIVLVLEFFVYILFDVMNYYYVQLFLSLLSYYTFGRCQSHNNFFFVPQKSIVIRYTWN